MLVIQDPLNVTYQRRYCGYTEGVVPHSLWRSSQAVC